MTRLLDQPDILAPLPRVDRGLIDAIERARLVGRGGASFPVATKWRAVEERSHRRAVVVVNGAEGEPQSKKDRLLMTTRPHLVLDGAFIAARVLRARRVILYIGERHSAARDSMLRALAQRSEPERNIVTYAAAPARYVAGAEAAVIHFLNDGVATPVNIPPYPFERGVEGAPTLVQNVETLAHVAILARTGEAPNRVLITLVGGVTRPGVFEVDSRTTITQAINQSGGLTEPARAVLVGGYFGSWMDPHEAWGVRLDPSASRLGCGVIGVLPSSRCAVCEVAAIMRYLAAESSAQCGPCFFGLRALADACTRIAGQGSNPEVLKRMQRWSAEVRGRGACKHPDGAVMFLSSALQVFGDEFASHRPHAKSEQVRLSA
ncbi:MAG TPA: NADH-ubiquinone oxidoreductase-F iron-sulfur binding region domain-containing protein [Candidatus Acidoferrum sp.]|nr:NADH-ubiquinone oxidoreductase-F iron-sulfur binding region domain-containing protein [Candidatus Acidoferrum sp.]